MKKYNENGRLHPRFTRSFFSIFRKFFFSGPSTYFLFLFWSQKMVSIFFFVFLFPFKKKKKKKKKSLQTTAHVSRECRDGGGGSKKIKKNFKKFQKKTLPKTGAS